MSNQKDDKVILLDNFYKDMQNCTKAREEQASFTYITSRSTEENVINIELLCSDVEKLCSKYFIPMQGVFLKKTYLSIQVFKYLICNTNFVTQSLLVKDAANGHLVNLQSPFSPYLFIEITWRINFESILAESILHFPLDLCNEILEILPRCIDLMNFERSSIFLSKIISNSYRKLITLKDTGTQSKDVKQSSKKFTGNMLQLFLQYTNERFLKLKDISKEEQYKRYGTVLKTLIRMVRACLTSNFKTTPSDIAIEEMYTLTFGPEPLEKIDNLLIQEYLDEVNRELISLLLKKVKEIDCNIYLAWMEHDDEENTMLTLQRSVGLECYFFMEDTKEFKDSSIQEYNHLVECLQQITSKPDPQNTMEILQLSDLCNGVAKGKKDCLVAVIKRYKEWNDSTIDTIDSYISLLNKDDCQELLEYFTAEYRHPHEQPLIEKLHLYYCCLTKALLYLEVMDLYELTIKFILKFGESNKFENIIDIINFEKFMMLNPFLSTPKSFRVVLLFMCLKTRSTLKILLKMAIGHSDYPDVAINLDDLMTLLPILKIQVRSQKSPLNTLCSSKKERHKLHSICNNGSHTSITLVVDILRDICLEKPGWDAKKFANILQILYSFCKVSEIINEVFTPFVMSNVCTLTYLMEILVELLKVTDKFDSEINGNILLALELQALDILKSNHISRYLVADILTMISHLMKLLDSKSITNYEVLNCNYSVFYFSDNTKSHDPILNNIIRVHSCYVESKLITNKEYSCDLIIEDVIRYLFLKCTRTQYVEYVGCLIAHNNIFLKKSNLLNICDKIIRLTIETCLFCLEFPEITSVDSVGFLIRCMLQILPMISKSMKRKKLKKFHQGICNSLSRHVSILKPIRQTAISYIFDQLVDSLEKSKSNFTMCIEAFEQFALGCMQLSEKLKHFDGIHTLFAIKIWFAHRLVTSAMNETIEECTKTYMDFFN